MDQLDELLEQYAAAADDATRLVETQPAARLTSRPNPARWSAVECLQHLAISNERFAPPLEEALEKARALPAAAGAYRMNFMARMLQWTLEPPARMRMPTPPAFIPRSHVPPEEALRTFLDSHNRLAALLSQGRGLALDKVEIVSPFAEKVRYSAWSAFVLAVVHERRHLWQAHRAVAV